VTTDDEPGSVETFGWSWLADGVSASSGGFSKVDLAAWLGLAILLFVGWMVVMVFLAASQSAHRLTVVAEGLVFSAIVATLFVRMFRTTTDVDESRTSGSLSETTIFAYPPGFRRLLRFGLVLWPLLFVAVSLVTWVASGSDHQPSSPG
jgi:glucan phosphoethanolaminetransferase (alkaline phosphatase superfamily)